MFFPCFSHFVHSHFFLILVSFHSSRNNNVLFCLLSEYCMDSGFLYYVCGQKKKEISMTIIQCLVSFLFVFGLCVCLFVRFTCDYHNQVFFQLYSWMYKNIAQFFQFMDAYFAFGFFAIHEEKLFISLSLSF